MNTFQRDEVHTVVLRILSNQYDDNDLELTTQFINEEWLPGSEIQKNDVVERLDLCRWIQCSFLRAEILGLVEQAHNANDSSPPEFCYDYCKEILEEADAFFSPISNADAIPKDYLRLILAIHEFAMFNEEISDDFEECQAIAEQVLGMLFISWGSDNS